MKAFYLKYYPPIEAYRDRGLIYNFWPHLGQSIAQAWGRLKKYLCKNPCHGISKSIILINFYVRLFHFIRTSWIIPLEEVLLVEEPMMHGNCWIW
jgi:hypothetical protein